MPHPRRSSRPRTAQCMRERTKDAACRRSTIRAARTEAKSLGDDVRRELVFDAADLVAQDELPLLQSLYLNEVGTGRGNQGRDGRVEVAVFLQQARQLLPQRAFFLVSHCHRCLRLAGPSRQKRANYCVFHKGVQAFGKSTPIKGFAPVCRSAKAGVPSL